MVNEWCCRKARRILPPKTDGLSRGRPKDSRDGFVEIFLQPKLVLARDPLKLFFQGRCVNSHGAGLGHAQNVVDSSGRVMVDTAESATPVARRGAHRRRLLNGRNNCAREFFFLSGVVLGSRENVDR